MTLLRECAVSEGCSAWKFRVFKDCICTTRDALSFYLGVASILCWGIAEVPQIIVNWRSGNSEGVSLAFILTWSVGDLFNLVGCLMDPVTLPTQFYTAVLYTATTLVLVGQHVWYNWGAGPDSAGAAYQYHLQQDEKESRTSSFARERESPLEGLFPTDPTLADGMKIPGVDSRRASDEGRRPHSNSVPAGQRQTSPGSYGGSWRRLTLSTSYGTSPRLRALVVAAVLTGGVQLGPPFWRQLRGDGVLSVPGQEVGSVFGTSRRLLQEGDLLLLPRGPRPWNGTALGELGPLPGGGGG